MKSTGSFHSNMKKKIFGNNHSYSKKVIKISSSRYLCIIEKIQIEAEYISEMLEDNFTFVEVV